MSWKLFELAGIFLALLGLSQFEPIPRGNPPKPKTSGSPEVPAHPPRWHVGQAWVIEAFTQAWQDSLRPRPAGPGLSIPWQFTVRSLDRIGGRPCFRVEVKCLLPGPPQPVTTFWAEHDTLALKQVQTQLPVAGGFRTIIESYAFGDGQPAPVLGPLTALPIDLPVFLGARAKSTQRFIYEAINGPEGKKAPNHLGFIFEVEQQIRRTPPEEVQKLVPSILPQNRPITEVRLKGMNRQVRQLWTAEAPWPVYSSNGATTARLVKVIPASHSLQP
jgi:hypothetical protein